MNDEQSKRLSEAADAVIQASEALEDARESLNDKRFDGDVERDRIAAGQQVASKLDAAGKKIEDAIRRGTIAAAALARAGAYAKYREATAAAREGRALARSAAEQDGAANKRARGQEALTKLEAALASAATNVFGD
jgi:hypothetical protein